MRLYLIRHAESTNNALGTISEEMYAKHRTADPELTDIGKEQAQLIGAFIAEHTQADVKSDRVAIEPFGFTHIYVSPMKRTLDTAKPIVEALGIAPAVWTDIHEIGGLFTAVTDDHGEEIITGYPGLTRAEITADYPTYNLPETVTEKGWWDVDRGRETPAEFVSRAITVALALRQRIYTDDRIALVAHGAFLDALLKALFNQAPTHPNQLYYGHFNTGITRIDYEKWDGSPSDRLYIRYMNNVTHLPVDLRTR